MPVPDDYFVEPNKQKTFTPIPADKYQVMIYDVNPLREPNFQGTGDVDKLEFVFMVLDDKKYQSQDENGEPQEQSTRGRRLWRKIPRSFSPGGKFKASLFFQLMCAVEGKQLSKEDLVRVQPNSLIGKQIAIFVSVNDQWNNIESFMATDKTLEGLPTALDEGKPEPEAPITASTENPKTAEEFNDKELEELFNKKD